MTLEEEVREIFRKFDKLNFHGKRKDSVQSAGYDPSSTLMGQLSKKNNNAT